MTHLPLPTPLPLRFFKFSSKWRATHNLSALLTYQQLFQNVKDKDSKFRHKYLPHSFKFFSFGGKKKKISQESLNLNLERLLGEDISVKGKTNLEKDLKLQVSGDGDSESSSKWLRSSFVYVYLHIGIKVDLKELRIY
jgi:hypothetical protein